MKYRRKIKKRFEVFNNRNVYFAIIIAGIIIYAKCTFFDFTSFDDTRLLVTNQTFIGNLNNMPKLFTTDVFITMPNAHLFYRPLLNLLFMIEAQAGHDYPLLYHFTNILLHLGCSILLYEILKKFHISITVAGIAALLFCVHPIQVSAVAWIPGCNDTLLTVILLGSFLFFLRAIKTSNAMPLTCHIALFFAALLVKETAVIFPLLCVAYLYLVSKKIPSKRKMISIIGGYFFVIILWMLMRNMVSRTFELSISLDTQLSEWIGNFPAILLYLGKIIFPFQFSVFPNLNDHSVVPGILTIFLLAGLFFASRPTNIGVIIWGLAWFVFFLTPSIMSGTVFYEHRAYCALAGFLVALVHFPIIRKIDLSKNIIFIFVVLLLTAFSVITFFRADNYKNRFNFAANALESAPGVDLSYSCMASLYLDEGNYDAAETVVLQGLRRNSGMNLVHRILGDIYTHRQKYSLAAREYEISLQIEPLNLYIYTNYGKMLVDAGDIEGAVNLWKKSLQINPDYLPAYYYLANCYVYSKNDPDSAMIYVGELQKRGEDVMPALINAIEKHPMYHHSFH